MAGASEDALQQMLKLAPEILSVVSCCELVAFLRYLGKTQVGFKSSEGLRICLV